MFILFYVNTCPIMKEVYVYVYICTCTCVYTCISVYVYAYNEYFSELLKLSFSRFKRNLQYFHLDLLFQFIALYIFFSVF